MKYMGSKARHAKELIPIITANRRPDQWYVEPFVGGGNVINKVPQGAGRLANDSNDLMVTLLDQLGNHGWVPPETFTESDWHKVKNSTPRTPGERALFAFCATGPSYGGKWWGGWARSVYGNDCVKAGLPRDHWREARANALKDVPGLKNVSFTSGSYTEFEMLIRTGSLVYCDPPYAGTTKYKGAKDWDAAAFWSWCDLLIDNLGCDVFVSEYSGPPHWDVVWSKTVTSDLSKRTAQGQRETECLFRRAR